MDETSTERRETALAILSFIGMAVAAVATCAIPAPLVATAGLVLGGA